MTAVLDPPTSRRSTDRGDIIPAERLRRVSAAVRVSFTWFGVRKSLSVEQKAQAAESFGATRDFLSAGKKLLDTRDSAFRAVTAVRSRILGHWRGVSLPYPEPGVRLLRQDRVAEFDRSMVEFREDLDAAVADLADHYGQLRATAQEQLGSLYNEADYPPTLVGLFAVDWDYPNVNPPDYLRQLAPELFEEESRRAAARFTEAVHLAEHAFAEEFAKLVSHLCERITGSERKIFRDSAVENLREFFNRFRQLNIGSNAELEEQVRAAQSLLEGIDPTQLRQDGWLRERIAADLAQVRHQLEPMLVDRPRRRILRPTLPQEGSHRLGQNAPRPFPCNDAERPFRPL